MHQPRTNPESGTALIVSMMFSVVALGIIASGTLILQANQRRTDTSFRVNAQANQFARAGITDALSWFRRQTTQPVLGFDPLLDTVASPQILDTDDPDVGIVREFRIADGIWGRYEVWKQWATDPDSARAAYRTQFEAADISLWRSQGSPGNSWRVRSVGYIYRRVDNTVALDASPNVRLGISMLEAEFKRLRLGAPGEAAVNISNGGSIAIGHNGRIDGGTSNPGIYYSGSGSPSNSGQVIGSPTQSYIAPALYDDSPESVFGLSLAELTSVSDDVITDPALFPSPIGNSTIVVAYPTTTLAFDSARPLRGTGVVYVQGNVVVAQGSNSVFNGLLYVEGNLTLREPSVINGTIICTGSMAVQGGSDRATVNYDPEILEQLRRDIGNYRLAGAVRPIGSSALR